MVRFLSIALALFLLFAGTWIWYSGDTRPLQVSYWQNWYASLSSSNQTATVAAVTAKPAAQVEKPTPPAEKPKAVSKPVETMAAAITRVATPAGRYVVAKLGAATPAAPAAATMAIAAVGSPAGRYVEAPKMAAPAQSTVSEIIKRIGSPIGRYVTAAMAAPAETTKVTSVGSPAGRYVDEPTATPVAPTQVTAVGSPAGRYVDEPTATPVAPTQVTAVGSPAGRYVDAPATTAKPAPTNLARVSSPTGRYVDAPKAAQPAPRKSASGALVFPVSFEYRKSSFTTKGQAAADQLLAHILAKKYKDVTLSGHTDSRGSQSVNMAISERRLQTVAEHLKDGGYSGEISLIPKGKSEPFTGIDRSKYTPEQLYDFDRRVELVSGE